MDAAAASSSSVRSLSANSSHEKINCRAIESMTASRAIIQYCSPTLFFRALLLIAKLIKISDLVCFASFGIYGSMRKNCILLSLSVLWWHIFVEILVSLAFSSIRQFAR
jgi:hypothetical protein